MVKTVKFGSLDALVGLSFDSASLAYSAPTKINGTVTNTTASTTEVLTYYGLSATVGSPFITLPNISFKVVSVSDATNELTIDAYYGSSMVAELGFTVTGFSAAGLALSSIPIDAMVLTGTNLPSLMGSAFVLGYNIAQAASQSIQFKESDLYSFTPSAKVVFGTAKADTITGTTGPQTLLGMDGNDRIVAGSGADMLYGGNGADVLIAGAGNDTLYGGAGNDLLYGSTGTSVLKGGAGNDTLRAWTGHTAMTGGDGADTFVFALGNTGGSSPSTADVINDFSHTAGDHINLSLFDSHLPAGGPTHLTFIGTAAFDGHAGEVRYETVGQNLAIYGDIDGDGTADFCIVAKSISTLVASDFLL